MKESGKKLQLKPNELDLLTPVATITRQRCTRIHVLLVVQGTVFGSWWQSSPGSARVVLQYVVMTVTLSILEGSVNSNEGHNQISDRIEEALYI